MNEVEALELVTRLISAQLGLDPSAIGPKALLLDDLGLDSIDVAEIGALIEDECGVEVMSGDVDPFQLFHSVDHLVQHLISSRVAA